ncbi:hypothetical protein JAAARDRAFT_80338 [Jaapia argillacea MUCL 33604]|uniref:Uncharacterized protein n=1 Tax=Jaapia argillacea MUCL 33604 TaxID=933084 RepID=A0A067PSS1_9AGAM|nr:hypothetical protein JAAARDRAFT_80338 [Jaapia argillacea MUCL 33604]
MSIRKVSAKFNPGFHTQNIARLYICPTCLTNFDDWRKDWRLALPEVAFTVYYHAVADKNSKKGLDWLVRHVDKSLKGYEHFLGAKGFISTSLYPLLYLYGWTIKVPIYPNVPLLNPHNAEPRPSLNQGEPETESQRQLESNRFPWFSFHIALVVLVQLTVMPKNHDTGKVKPKLYTQPEDVTGQMANPPTRSPSTSTNSSSEERRYIWATTLSNDSYKPAIVVNCSCLIKTARKLAVMVERLWGRRTVVNVGMGVRASSIGISGGMGVEGVTLLLSPTPGSYARIPVTKAVVHDPWLEPLPSSGSTPYPPRPLSSTTPSSDIINGAVVPTLILALDRSFRKVTGYR